MGVRRAKGGAGGVGVGGRINMDGMLIFFLPRQIYVTLRDERREAAVVAAERKAAEQDRL